MGGKSNARETASKDGLSSNRGWQQRMPCVIVCDLGEASSNAMWASLQSISGDGPVITDNTPFDLSRNKYGFDLEETSLPA